MRVFERGAGVRLGLVKIVERRRTEGTKFRASQSNRKAEIKSLIASPLRGTFKLCGPSDRDFHSRISLLT